MKRLQKQSSLDTVCSFQSVSLASSKSASVWPACSSVEADLSQADTLDTKVDEICHALVKKVGPIALSQQSSGLKIHQLLVQEGDCEYDIVVLINNAGSLGDVSKLCHQQRSASEIHSYMCLNVTAPTVLA